MCTLACCIWSLLYRPTQFSECVFYMYVYYMCLYWCQWVWFYCYVCVPVCSTGAISGSEHLLFLFTSLHLLLLLLCPLLTLSLLHHHHTHLYVSQALSSSSLTFSPSNLPLLPPLFPLSLPPSLSHSLTLSLPLFSPSLFKMLTTLTCMRCVTLYSNRCILLLQSCHISGCGSYSIVRSHLW